MNAHERMPKGTRFSLLAVGIGLTWLLLPVLSFAQVAPVVQFSFSGAHSAGPVTGTFTLDRLNGVLTDFDVMTPFFHYTPSNTLFVASDQPGGFTVSLLVLPFTNAPRYLNLSFAGSVETFNGGGTIPRVDILVNGQSNIAYFLTQEQFQGVYTVSGSAQINTDQMTPFSYGIALGCLSRSAVQGVCDEGSSKNAQVAHDGIASMNSTYVGPTSPQAQLAFNAIGGSGYGALRARATDSFDISSTPAIAYGAGIGEFRDVLTVDSPPFTGQTGLLLVQYILVGNISASNAIAFTEVLVDVYGPYFTNLQEISAVHSCVFPLQTCSVGALFTVQKFFRFVYGQPLALEFALVAQSGDRKSV